MIRSAIKKFLLRRGIVLSRPPGQFSVTEFKFQAIKQRGLDLKCIVDGGADIGEWTREIKKIYPNAAVLAIEPRHEAKDALRKLSADFPDVQVAQALLGPSEQTVEFHSMGVMSSALPDSRGAAFGTTISMPMTKLDNLIEQRRMPWPDLIKLDLQGFELDALRGAEQCLIHGQAVLLEVSFFRFQKGTPLAHEVFDFMGERGFRIYDIFALWHRPLDGALAQGDFLFLKEGHPLLRDESWQSQTLPAAHTE